MNENKALEKAFEVLARADKRKLNQEDEKELKELERYISKDKMGEIWGGYETVRERIIE